MNKAITFLAVLAVSILSTSCQGHQSIDSLLQQQYNKGNLNGNVLVIKDGKTLYEKSFGVSDGSQSTALTKDHKFQIGSIYKEFPAVAILQLQEKQLLDVNDPISTYLPAFPVWAQEVTITHLLQYSSGLPEIEWDDYFGKGINITEPHLLEEIQNIKTLEFTPGTDYFYTNSSPILLTKIVENISGMPFDAYLDKNIFEPYQLEGIILKDQYPYTDTTLEALPFNEDFEEDAYEISVKSMLFSATAGAMAQWVELLGDFKIVDQEAVQFLSAEAKKGRNIQSSLGLYEWENGKSVEHSHHGSSANYEGVVRRFKQEDMTIVILTNQKHGNVYDLSDEILDIVRIATPE